MWLSAPENVLASPKLTSSKSESNRALIIKALCKNKINIENISNADDTQLLASSLSSIRNKSHFNCKNAGTTLRFLTAFLSIQKGTWTLTGSKRMTQRPIGPLALALNELGANIQFKKKKGFPPLKITGADLFGKSIEIQGDISSQFISALLLISPMLKNGLIINIKGTIFSKPYIDMTLKMMKHFGVNHTWTNNQIIHILAQKYIGGNFKVETDWSAASYWYSIAALSKKCKIQIKGLRKDSLQGDSNIIKYFKPLGVLTSFTNNGIEIKKAPSSVNGTYKMNLINNPDLAQSLAVTCVGLGLECHLSGLNTLLLKETNRLKALQTELTKVGVQSIIDLNSITIPGKQKLLKSEAPIATYGDHRMAMSFAPLSLVLGKLNLDDPEVVNKSYPDFWNDLKSAGFIIQ